MISFLCFFLLKFLLKFNTITVKPHLFFLLVGRLSLKMRVTQLEFTQTALSATALLLRVGVVNGVLDTQGNCADLGKLKNNENAGPMLIRNQINLILTAYSE
jgi:hypothetical protein